MFLTTQCVSQSHHLSQHRGLKLFFFPSIEFPTGNSFTHRAPSGLVDLRTYTYILYMSHLFYMTQFTCSSNGTCFTEQAPYLMLSFIKCSVCSEDILCAETSATCTIVKISKTDHVLQHLLPASQYQKLM